MKNQIRRLFALLLLPALSLQASTARAQNTVFTYQGQVLDNGANFTGSGQFKFALVTSANGASQATATADPPSNGYITGYTVTAGGSGYLTAPTVTVVGGGGSGAQAKAEISSGGVVTNLAVVSFGNANYTSAPTVTIAAPPALTTYTTYWSNDGTSSAGSEPAAAVNVGVANGLFTVALGDTNVANMTAIEVSTFYQPNLQLRTWFSDGVNGFAALSPLLNLSAAPYSIMANSASNLVGTLPASQLTGEFSGNAGGLTNLNASQLTGGTVPVAALPSVVVTNTATGVTLSGTFTGNGAGVTNVTASTLATPQGMTLIPAGTFTMGNSIGDSDITDATPTNITVSAFYMYINLASYAQWQSVYFWATNNDYSFDNAGSGKAPNHPVQSVNWFDVVKWCNARSQQAGLTPVYYTDAALTQVYSAGDVAPYVNWGAGGYRLPTEAEWEKAARGGLSGQRFPWGDIITENLANYYGNTSDYGYDLGPNGYNALFDTGAYPYTSPAGYFVASGYGLYDMAGNVEEWCWDWYGSPYGQPTTTNPTGPPSGSGRVLRGGGWYGSAVLARCAYRYDFNPLLGNHYVGFRCVRGL